MATPRDLLARMQVVFVLTLANAILASLAKIDIHVNLSLASFHKRGENKLDYLVHKYRYFVYKTT
jgi:hypothetical protein